MAEQVSKTKTTKVDSFQKDVTVDTKTSQCENDIDKQEKKVHQKVICRTNDFGRTQCKKNLSVSLHKGSLSYRKWSLDESSGCK